MVRSAGQVSHGRYFGTAVNKSSKHGWASSVALPWYALINHIPLEIYVRL